jgi:hypothetical protein
MNRSQYPVSTMCQFFDVSRSGYYAFVRRIGKPEADADLAEKIQECQATCDKTYGYRRMQEWLETQGIHRNPKTVLRVMKNTTFSLRFAAAEGGNRWGSSYTSTRIF